MTYSPTIQSIDNKKTWTNNFVYVSEVSPNTIAPYTSKSPRQRAWASTFTLGASFKLAIFPKQE